MNAPTAPAANANAVAPTAEDIFNAMRDLRKGRITPDAFRDTMRRSRELSGESAHAILKAQALASFSR